MPNIVGSSQEKGNDDIFHAAAEDVYTQPTPQAEGNDHKNDAAVEEKLETSDIAAISDIIAEHKR